MIDYTYFISDGKFIKIGRSKRPYQRLSQLQTSYPEKLEIIALSLETENNVQEKFNQFRKMGEWFEFTKEIKNYIKNLPELEYFQPLTKTCKIPIELHTIIKTKASNKRIAIEGWLIEAIKLKLKEDNWKKISQKFYKYLTTILIFVEEQKLLEDFLEEFPSITQEVFRNMIKQIEEVDIYD